MLLLELVLYFLIRMIRMMMIHLHSKELVVTHTMVVVAPVVVLLSTVVQAQVQVQGLLFLMQTIQRKILLHCWEQLVDTATSAVLL